MRIGLVVPVYNRPEYLRPSLQSIAATRCEHVMYLVNDAGTDVAANRLFDDFIPPWPGYLKVVNPINKNIHGCLLAGWRHFFDDGFDILANLDSDTLVQPDWLDALRKLHLRFPDHIITGFNTLTHRVRRVDTDHCLKDSIGGINMLFGRHLFPMVEPCLSQWDWDWQVCAVMQQLGRPFIVSRPSVVQHLGQNGLTSNPERGVPVAVDFGGVDAKYSRMRRRTRNA